MAKICDNKSVGQLLYHDRHLVLIKRKNYPQAYALPAGHLDGDEFLAGALRETEEEVGVIVTENKLVWKGLVANPCKRDGGTYHEWEVYKAQSWKGEPKAGSDAKEFLWVLPAELKRLAERTEYFIKKYQTDDVGALTKAIFGDPAEKKTDPEWIAEMGLEPVWYFILKELKIL